MVRSNSEREYRVLVEEEGELKHLPGATYGSFQRAKNRADAHGRAVVMRIGKIGSSGWGSGIRPIVHSIAYNSGVAFAFLKCGHRRILSSLNPLDIGKMFTFCAECGSYHRIISTGKEKDRRYAEN